jgi:hypothetical protein
MIEALLLMLASLMGAGGVALLAASARAAKDAGLDGCRRRNRPGARPEAARPHRRRRSDRRRGVVRGRSGAARLCRPPPVSNGGANRRHRADRELADACGSRAFFGVALGRRLLYFFLFLHFLPGFPQRISSTPAALLTNRVRDNNATRPSARPARRRGRHESRFGHHPNHNAVEAAQASSAVDHTLKDAREPRFEPHWQGRERHPE